MVNELSNRKSEKAARKFANPPPRYAKPGRVSMGIEIVNTVVIIEKLPDAFLVKCG